MSNENKDNKVTMPSVSAVASEMQALAKAVARSVGFEGEEPELRLQVYPDGDWILRWGLSDYDQDHRGFWGASFLPAPTESPEVFRAVAKALVEQAAEQAAFAGLLAEEEA